jgi:RNA polymerase sigma factor (sigma-70 family)
MASQRPSRPGVGGPHACTARCEAGHESGEDNFAELDALYQEWGPGLVRWLQWQLQSSWGLAEDVAQDAFLIMWRRWPHIRSHPNLRGYLYTTAMRLMWDVARERSRAFLRAEPSHEAGSRMENPSDSYDKSLAVRAAIEKLPPRQRQAVWLHYICGFKQDEVAAIMQIKRGAVGALLFQARSRLAELIG